MKVYPGYEGYEGMYEGMKVYPGYEGYEGYIIYGVRSPDIIPLYPGYYTVVPGYSYHYTFVRPRTPYIDILVPLYSGY